MVSVRKPPIPSTRCCDTMSDSEDYEYEYDASDQEDDGGGGGGGGNNAYNDDEDQSFEYEDSDNDNENGNNDNGGGNGDGQEEDIEITLENTYYNAKGERDAGDYDEACLTFENVIQIEVRQNKKIAGIVDVIGNNEEEEEKENNAMDVEGENDSMKITPLLYHGSWSYKAIKQLVKIHLRTVDGTAVLSNYARMLRVASSPNAAISPNALEKGVNTMLDRVSNLIVSQSAQLQQQQMATTASSTTTTSTASTIARDVYDLTLKAFHPTTGLCPNERLWFKTNLKYGQLLYEMNDTNKLQLVIRDLLISSGQTVDVLGDDLDPTNTTRTINYSNNSNNNTTNSSGGGGGGTHVMEIAALQIQLYSRLKDTKRLRAAYHRAISVRGGIPHPRTLALIQELGGKMNMSQRNFHDASQSFFQAFKSYDEAGDRARLRCLKYLVMASMLHASSINPFDSHEARAHRDDLEIVAMTNLVHAFHNDDIKGFERILNKNEGRIMDDEFVREHVADLLRTIRTQVILKNIGPYTRIRLSRIASDLNYIPVDDVERLLVSLILDGKLDGYIDQVSGILVKNDVGSSSGEKDAANPAKEGGGNMSIEDRNLTSLTQLTSALEHLTTVVTKVGTKGTSSQSVM